LGIHNNSDVSVVGSPGLLEYGGNLATASTPHEHHSETKETYVTKVRLLQPTFDNAGGCLRIVRDKLATDDWGADQLRGVDDLFDPWYAERDVHGSDSRKVECLQSHLSPWLTNRLGTNGPNG
jgi:hypothetical protein